MLKIKITLYSLIAILLFSCNSKLKEEKTSEINIKEHQNNESIQLDGSKKWKVDKNMLSHIRNMEKDVLNIDVSKPENLTILAENLNKNIHLLTSNCTMKGQAHDELHKWLLPYIELVNQFSDAPSVESLNELKNNFNTFNQYFE